MTSLFSYFTSEFRSLKMSTPQKSSLTDFTTEDLLFVIIKSLLDQPDPVQYTQKFRQSIGVTDDTQIRSVELGALKTLLFGYNMGQHVTTLTPQMNDILDLLTQKNLLSWFEKCVAWAQSSTVVTPKIFTSYLIQQSLQLNMRLQSFLDAVKKLATQNNTVSSETSQTSGISSNLSTGIAISLIIASCIFTLIRWYATYRGALSIGRAIRQRLQ